jgi:hypothetical protein
MLVATIYLVINRIYALSWKYGTVERPNPKKFGLIGTGVVGVLIALQSLGELTLRDLLMAIPLAIVLYAYMTYGRTKTRTAPL